jgi:hypothetical protein
VIGHRVTFLFSQPLLQATYDLAGASQCEGNCVPKDLSLRHCSLEHKENKRASRYILCTAPQEAQAGTEREEVQAQRWTATKKEPRERSILGAYSSLCSRLFCPGDFGGVGGRGQVAGRAYLTSSTLPDLARAIRDSHHNLQHFEQS